MTGVLLPLAIVFSAVVALVVYVESATSKKLRQSRKRRLLRRRPSWTQQRPQRDLTIPDWGIRDLTIPDWSAR